MANEPAPNGFEKKSHDQYDNPLTRQDVETIIAKSLGPNYKIHNYYMRNHSNEHVGFMGAHRNFIVEVSKEGSTQKELHTYFLKSVPYNVYDHAKFVKESKMFHKETSFYELIMPELMKSSRDKSWAPQCYLVKDDALVFENLVIKNYTMKADRLLDVASLEAALSSLAKMHAASMLAEKRLGKSFLDMYPDLMEEILFSRTKLFAMWNKCGIDVLTNIAKYLGLDDEVVPKVCNLIYEKLRPSKTRRNVINHGDAWANNLMFNESKCILVDFQLVRYVPAMSDVALLFYHNAKKELRDKYEMNLLKHYHTTLCDVLKDGGVDIPEFVDIVDEYEEMRIVGLVTTNMYYQINQIPGDKQLELMSTSQGFNDLLFRDRVDLILGFMKTDGRYREILSSVVKELVESAPKYLK
ncbi:uncharacterized protein LOC131666426 [Phymastichus coffea]|uniref:uncharacterized protein LOC131666426 n=1 Tax=Phymastichus coffea TaxID=108790 RepID=UPI00273AA7DE|nr:uncharacterized protein LOC131666426 [Phymastichus coffea]